MGLLRMVGRALLPSSLLWLGVFLPACAGEQPTDGAAEIVLPGVELLRIDGRDLASPGDVGTPVAPGTPDDPCTCDGPECLEEWVAENFGCDLCVAIVCEGAPEAHSCHLCGESEGPALEQATAPAIAPATGS